MKQMLRPSFGKVLAGMIALVTLTTACQDNNPVTPEEKEKWRLAKQTSDYYIDLYHYNEDGTLGKVTRTMKGNDTWTDTMQLTWQNGKLQKAAWKEISKTFSYIGDRLSKVEYRSSINSFQTDTFKYENNKLVTIAFGANNFLDLTWTGDNITKEERYSITQQGERAVYAKVETTYDLDKPNINLLSNNQLYYCVSDTTDLCIFSKNLPVKRELSYHWFNDGQPSMEHFVFTFDPVNKLLKSIAFRREEGGDTYSTREFEFVENQ